MNYLQSNPNYHYILVLEDSHSRRTISLEESKYYLGRHSSNSIVIHSRQVSRKHATLIRKFNRKTNQNSFWILDGDLEGNKSQNGVFVNGQKCLIHELQNGDLINFGCEVNASYHFVSNTKIDQESETTQISTNNQAINNNDPSKLAKISSNDPHQQSTLVLGDSHVKEVSNDDTFQEHSYLDPVTELPNRILLQEYLSIALTNAKRSQTCAALILIDIKHFSKINDEFGYKVGDQFLIAIAQRLKQCLREGDIISRWGGDEFAILLPNLKDDQDLQKITQRIIKELKSPFTVQQHCQLLSTYLGIAIYPNKGKNSQEIIDYAETRLNENQASNIQQSFNHKKSQSSPKLSQIEERLYQALEQQEMLLYYQPQLNIKTNKIEGIEALIRWNHPKHGLISPQQFLPFVDKTELIMPLTQWILETACQQNKTWQTQHLPSIIVSVNLSVNQFHHPQLIDLIESSLTKTNLEPQWLELEITESSLLKNTESASQTLTKLKALGVHLCLDDFGIGYIAVKNLHQMPFNKVKIDVSLIQEITKNSENTMLVSALIALGENFKMRVVAEGVETEKQFDALFNLHCETMQGYRFSRPLPVEEATRFLTFHSSAVA